MTALPTRIIVGPLCLLVMLGGLTAGQHRLEDQPLTEELYALVDERTTVIKQSVAKSKNEWAGTYAAGDHHPTVFMWAPDEGFLVTSSNHTFSPSWINYGEVSLTGSVLSIRPVLPKDNKYAHQLDTEFRMVKWGQQHFLISPDELKSFAYAVHSQAESEIVHYFFRWEDQDKPRRGLPNLPPEFTKYMRLAPVLARISAVGSEEGPFQEVTLSVGQRSNVTEGMVFYFAPRDGAQFSIRVREVSESSSKGYVESIAITGSAERLRLRRGLRLTSRIPKGFVEPG